MVILITQIFMQDLTLKHALLISVISFPCLPFLETKALSYACAKRAIALQVAKLDVTRCNGYRNFGNH